MTYYPDNYEDTELNSMILTRMYEYYNDRADELYEKLESSLDDDAVLNIEEEIDAQVQFMLDEML